MRSKFLAVGLLLVSLISSSLFGTPAAPVQQVVRRPISVGIVNPAFTNVKLLLHLDGSDAATTTTDSSSAAHSMSFLGDAQIDTAQSKWGGSSLLLDGTGDYLTTPDSSDWQFLGDFVVEAWVRFASTSGNQVIASHYDSSLNSRGWFWRATATTMDFARCESLSACTNVYSFSWTHTTGTWYHIAVSRTGSTLRLLADGAELGNTSDSTGTNNSSSVLRIGAIFTGGVNTQFVNGWIDDMRITNGQGLYGATYVVPTGPFPDS